MITKQNKIIVVDNEENELERLGGAFLSLGIGCRTILYDISYAEEAFKNVRLAFFDINLTVGNQVSEGEDIDSLISNNSAVFNDLANAISQYISMDNGPYALFFWTKNSTLVDAFKKYVVERRSEDVPKPIFIGLLDKVEFSADTIEKLPNAVLSLINENEHLKFLFELEENCRLSGQQVLNKLFDIIPQSDNWDSNNDFIGNLDLVLSKLASSSLGYDYAKVDKKKALYEGIIPIVSHELSNSMSDVDWNLVLNKLHNSTSYNELNDPSSLNVMNKLNSLYHIENMVRSEYGYRGNVIEIQKLESVLISFGIEDFACWFNMFIPIENSNERRKIRNNAKLIAIEISAACDFSNNKKRINKYILGVILHDSNIKGLLARDRRPDTHYHLGECSFNLDGPNFDIILNLNYVFSAKSDDERFEKSLFVLKKEIMDMLGNRYANHISRIGITSL